jgi:hydroxymethylbilane synthase
VGTASLRRQAQTLHLRPDLKVELLRGRVETRLAKIENGIFDATFLAMAGLKRLGLEHHVASIVDVQTMLPAPAQGALAITCRANDEQARTLLQKLDIAEYNIAAATERAFLQALDGSCRTPIAALAQIDGATLTFLGEVLTPDGTKHWRREGNSDATMAAGTALGAELGKQIREQAGPHYSAHFGDQGW